MKNSFIRFSFAVLLSAVAGMALAGNNYKALIPGGANQVSVKISNGRNQEGEVFDNGGKTVTDKGVVSGTYDRPYVGLDGVEYTPIQGCKVVKDRNGNDQVVCNTADAAVAASKKNFGGKPNEQGDCGYVLKGDDGQSMHYRKYGQEGDTGSISIKCPRTDDSLGAVATKENARHSHPKGDMVCRDDKPCSHAWFSNQDILTAIRSGEVSYVEDDITGIQLAFDPQDGSVYYVDNVGERFKLKVVEADDGGVRAYHPSGTELPLDSDLLTFDKISKDGKFNPGAGYHPSELEKLRKIAKDTSENSEGAPGGAVKIPDFSKLIDLLKEVVGCLSRINAMSHKPSKDDRVGYNKLMSRCLDELIAIGYEIERMNLSEEEKSRFKDKLDERFRESVMPYIDKINTLQKQIEAKGYGRFDGIDPKYERFRLGTPNATQAVR